MASQTIKETRWTCDRCGRKELQTGKLCGYMPDGWGKLNPTGNKEFDVCKKCFEEWNKKYIRDMAEFVMDKSQREAFRAGVPLEDVIGS